MTKTIRCGCTARPIRPVAAAVLAAAALLDGSARAQMEEGLSSTEWRSDDVCIRDYIIHEGVETFYSTFLYDRLELGLRWQYLYLLNSSERRYNSEGEFVGGFGYHIGVSELEEEQELWPRLFVRYRFTPYVGLELGWERLEAETQNEGMGYTDGDVRVSGPAVLLMGRYPNESRYVPFAGVGFALLDGSFDMDEKWHNGPGYTRNLSVGDATGFVLTGGCDVKLRHRVALDFALRYLDATLDADYHIEWEDGHDSNFASFRLPMESLLFQMGVVYAF